MTPGLRAMPASRTGIRRRRARLDARAGLQPVLAVDHDPVARRDAIGDDRDCLRRPCRTVTGRPRPYRRA